VEAITDQADKKISVKSSKDQSHGYIYVVDNGPGIPKENQDKIFSPFFTTKTATTRGVGLGLSLALVYMREMGGDILFETGKNGSTFILKIPLTTVALPEAANG
jgi:signal transduction histidine kinase